MMMLFIEVIERLELRRKAGVVPACLAGQREDLLYSAFGAALASLSGFLDDVTDDAALDAAMEHGVALVNTGVLTWADVNAERNRIVGELLKWGDKKHGSDVWTQWKHLTGC